SFALIVLQRASMHRSLCQRAGLVGTELPVSRIEAPGNSPQATALIAAILARYTAPVSWDRAGGPGTFLHFDTGPGWELTWQWGQYLYRDSPSSRTKPIELGSVRLQRPCTRRPRRNEV